MSEPGTPTSPEERVDAAEDAQRPEEPQSDQDSYHGPDPEEDPKGDGSDEDQGT